MVLATASLGLRVSETPAFRWEDFDFGKKTLKVQRAYTHQELKNTKSASSKAAVPVPAALLKALNEACGNQKTGVGFPFPHYRSTVCCWNDSAVPHQACRIEAGLWQRRLA
jgi:integrase